MEDLNKRLVEIEYILRKLEDEYIKKYHKKYGIILKKIKIRTIFLSMMIVRIYLNKI